MQENREKFGIHYDNTSGLLKVNRSEAAVGVTSELSQTFGYEPSRGLILPLDQQRAWGILSGMYRIRGYAEEDAYQIVEYCAESLVAGAMFVGDISSQLPYSPEYVVFFGKKSGRDGDTFVTILGEEILHGEHMAHHARVNGIGRSEYKKTFPGVTAEFLGYTGRFVVGKVAGLKVGSFKGTYHNFSLGNNDDLSSLAHDLAYLAVENMGDQIFDLPFAELFRAKTSVEFWQIIRSVRPEGFRVSFSLDQGMDYNEVFAALNKIVKDAKAEKLFSFLVIPNQ